MKAQNEQKQPRQTLDEPKAKGKQLDSRRVIPSGKELLTENKNK